MNDCRGEFFSNLSNLAKNDPEKFTIVRQNMIADFMSGGTDNISLNALQYEIENILRNADTSQALKEIVQLMEERVSAFECVSSFLLQNIALDQKQ